MSRVNRDLVSRVRFEADSRMASASMDALGQHATELQRKIDGVNADIKALGNVSPDDAAFKALDQQLKKLNSDLKDVNATMKDYTRGAKAAGELYRYYANGNLEDMSVKSIRAGINGMKKRYDNLKAGGNPADAEQMRLIETIMNEADVVVKRFKTDYEYVVQQINAGATVTEQTLRRTRDGLNDLMQTAESPAEKNVLQNYWQQVNRALDETIAENRRLKGEIADRTDAMRIANATDHDGAQQAIRDAEARAEAARKENEEIGRRLAANRQLRDDLQTEMDVNSIQQQNLMRQKQELRLQEKEDRTARQQRVDDARKEQNAARRAAKEQQRAYDEQKGAVEKLRTEVQGLTTDIEKMGQQEVKPKVDTSEIERLNAELKEAQRVLGNASAYEKLEQAKLEGMRSSFSKFEAEFRSKQERLQKFQNDTYDLQERKNELEWAIEPFSRKGRNKGQYHFDIHDIEQQRVAIEKLDEAFRRLHDDEYFKSASLSRQYELLGTAAFGFSDAEQQFGSYERAIRSLGVAVEETGAKFRLTFQGAGVDKSFQGVEFLDGYVSRRKELAQLNSDIKKALGDTDIDQLVKDVEIEGKIVRENTEKLRKQEEEVERWGKLKKEYADKAAEAERKYNEAQQQSTQTTQAETEGDEKLAQAKEKLARKQGELQQQEAALNEQADKTIAANQRLRDADNEAAAATEAQVEANKHKGEAAKKLDEQMDALTGKQHENAQQMSELTRAIDDDTKAIDRNLATQQEATREADDLRSGSIEKMQQAIARLRESNAKLDPVVDKEEWEKGERAIGTLTQRMEELKKKQAELQGEARLKMMTDRMKDISTVSKDALEETRKFWEAMEAGADRNDPKLAEIKQHLKDIAAEEQERMKVAGREAFSWFNQGQYKTADAGETEERRKALTAYRDSLPADAIDHIEAINKLLEEQAQHAKELSGEWMSLTQAEEIASKAGGDGFIATAQQMTQATQAIERQRDALIKTIQQKQRDGKATADEEKELQRLEKVLKDLKFEQDNFNMSHKQMDALLKQPKSAEDLNQLKAAIKRADGELMRMKQSLGENNKQYKEFAAQVKNAKNELKMMEGQAKGTASAFDKAWSRLKTYVGLYVGAAVAMQKLTATMGDLMELSDKMGEVRKTTGFTADEVGRLTTSLKQLDTRTSLVGLMELSSIAGSIGLKTQQDVEGFTIAANKLMVALPEMGSEAARTLMKIADATGDLEKNGRDVEQTLEKVGSTIIALRANSAAAAGPITDFVSRVGAVGAQAGISIDQIAALGATVDALGGRVEMSATALSRMIPAIKNNTFAVASAIGMTEKELKGMTGMEQMVEIFRRLHDSVKQFDTSTDEGMNAMADKVEQMLGNSASMQEVMKVLNQQGARAGIVFGLLSQNVDKLEEQLRIAGDAYKDNTALMKEYNNMNETTAAKWERLKNQLEEAFVSDRMQRWLGDIIDFLRVLVDFITGRVDGVLKGLRTVVLTVAMAWAVLKMQVGSGVFALAAKAIKNMIVSLNAMRVTLVAGSKDMLFFFTHIGTAIKAGIYNMGLFRKSTAAAAFTWEQSVKKINKAQMANVFLAIAAAILTAYLALKDWIGGSDVAARTFENLNQKIDDEKDKLKKLVNAYHDANVNTDKRKNLLNEINQKYSKYLGFLLSDAENANLVAVAHERIAAAMEKEMLERERASAISSVKDEYRDELIENWSAFTKELREAGGLDASQIAQARGDIQAFLDTISYNPDSGAVVFPAQTVGELNTYLARMGTSNPDIMSGDVEDVIAMWVYKYLQESFNVSNQKLFDITGILFNGNGWVQGYNTGVVAETAGNIFGATDFRKDYAKTLVKQLQQVGEVENYINGAIANADKKFADTTNKAIEELQETAEKTVTVINDVNSSDEAIAEAYTKLADAVNGLEEISTQLNQSTNQADHVTAQGVTNYVAAIRGQQTNQSNTQAPTNYVERSSGQGANQPQYWQGIDQRRLTQTQQQRRQQYNNINTPSNNTDDNDNNDRRPYGNYDKRVDPYEQWDANALVKRREEMLERVRALAGGADVQAVLSEDKKFMDEATRKGIHDMRQAIEWYNTERLKIQEELHSRNLTNTGDWLEPTKGGSKRKPRTPELEGAIAELDRYYLERKEMIEEARSKEEMTEAEYNRRLDALEMEHLQKRSDLRKTFTSDDREFIMQYREWWASVEELDEVSWEAIEAEMAAATVRDRKYINRAAQKDLTQMQAIIVKQLHEIEAIIDKERPFNGITRNLQDNLTKMGLLFKDGVPEGDEFMKQNTHRLTFLLKEAENAYTMTWEQLEQDMRQNGLGAWADAIIGSENADKEKRAMIAQLHEVYDAVQEAIKKEASIVKKQVDIQWNDAILPNGKSLKATYEAAISALGVQQSSVSRANSLIGAGAASERVADRLAIRQMQIQLQMQEHYYNLVRKTGQQRVDDLLRAAAEQRRLNNLDEAEKLELDAKHAQMSLNLSLSKEETELAKQREEIIARTEESQNRLYTSLKEWGDLLAQSLQSLFEASNAGNAEYYNELAKLNLTGKGGPGAGTYIVIDNEGTSDARAHYEYLDERQALERQHEIEQENARAEAWRKVMDDLNNKLSEQIGDWLNAAAQQAALDRNTTELGNLQIELGNEQTEINTNTGALGTNTNAMTMLTGAVNNLAGTITAQNATEAAYRQGGNGRSLPDMGVGSDGVPNALRRPEETAPAQATYTSPWQQAAPTGGSEQGEWLSPLAPVADTEAVVEPWQAMADASTLATQTVRDNLAGIQTDTNTTGKQMVKSNQSTFAKMAAAANLYGIAYQAMSNDNLSATQKFEMIALQSVGNFAISSLTAFMSKAVAEGAVNEATVLGKLWSQLGWAAAPVFAIFTGLLGGLMGAATSKVAKSKSQIAQATGSSASAGRLATGMLTYAEGNVNEFTDPATLTPGRQYNVDAADGRTYRARYMGTNPRTHITNGPEFHLSGERGREMIIDAGTTRQITMNEAEIWHAIQTLSTGGTLRRPSSLRRRGIAAHADGNLDEFEDVMGDGSAVGSGDSGMSMEMMASMQETNSRLADLLEQALTNGIKAVNKWTGPDGIPNMVNQYNKQAARHGEKYL